MTLSHNDQGMKPAFT